MNNILLCEPTASHQDVHFQQLATRLSRYVRLSIEGRTVLLEEGPEVSGELTAATQTVFIQVEVNGISGENINQVSCQVLLINDLPRRMRGSFQLAVLQLQL